MKIVSLSGFVPEYICDVVRFERYDGDCEINHLCGYVSDFISMVQNQGDIDGVVFPRSCDSSRVISSYLDKCGKFLYQLPVPASNCKEAKAFFAKCLMNYKNAIEVHFGTEINNIEERINCINNRNRSIRKLYELLGKDIVYSEYIKLIHNNLQLPLFKQNFDFISTTKVEDNEKKVYIVGSFLVNVEICKKIEDAGMTIVGDNLPESKRLFSIGDVSKEGNVFENIANSMLDNQTSPTQNNFEEIIENDLKEIKCKDVKGVIFIKQKYCEPYDYLFSVYAKRLIEKEVRSVKIDLSGTNDQKKFDLILEAFANTL